MAKNLNKTLEGAIKAQGREWTCINPSLCLCTAYGL